MIPKSPGSCLPTGLAVSERHPVHVTLAWCVPVPGLVHRGRRLAGGLSGSWVLGPSCSHARTLCLSVTARPGPMEGPRVLLDVDAWGMAGEHLGAGTCPVLRVSHTGSGRPWLSKAGAQVPRTQAKLGPRRPVPAPSSICLVLHRQEEAVAPVSAAGGGWRKVPVQFAWLP